jgi:hypothetical protein
VIEAVLRGRGYPDGFDPDRLDTAHDGLVRKRAWAVAGAWPLLARSFGPAYLEVFGEYVGRHPFQPSDGSLLDGLRFARFLARTGRLPDVGRIQAFSFRLHHVVRDEQVCHRRSPVVRVTRLRHPPYVVVGLALRGRVQVWRIPLGRRRMRPSGTR